MVRSGDFLDLRRRAAMIFLRADCYRQSDRGDIELPVHQGVAAAELSQSYVARKDCPTVPQRHLIPYRVRMEKNPGGPKGETAADRDA